MVCIELCNEVDAKHKHTSVSDDDVLANRWREKEERKGDERANKEREKPYFQNRKSGRADPSNVYEYENLGSCFSLFLQYHSSLPILTGEA